MDWTVPFDRLEPGLRFTTPARHIELADIHAFAALTGDHHPQHVDAYWAARSPFGERIAHGLLVVSLAAGLVPFDPERVVALRRVADVVFKRPVKPGDTIHVEGAVAEVRALGDGPGLVAFTWTVRNQHGEACCRARVEVLWARETEDLDPFAPTATGLIAGAS